MKYNFLRKQYKKFVYEKFSYGISKNNLEILFDFRLEPGISFSPRITVENIDKKKFKKINPETIDNLIFHLGLIEMPSYWKAACPRSIEIKCGRLSSGQIKWWEKIFVDGMGQFYFENKIDWRAKDFIGITSQGKIYKKYSGKLENRYLVPFAGGRDSIVTLESLKERGEDIALFTVNPIDKIQKTAKVSGIKKQIIVRRIIDKKLLQLNGEGFLNGHTPFTSLLSFLALFCAVIFGYKNIVFSNEKSADEGNTEYLGKMINHQWAKSSVFEKMFKDYSKKYLVKNINYFSYLREHTELEISKMLTCYPQYFPVFSSCNAGMKMGKKGTLEAKERWCGNCPKCLFVYMSLYPFLDEGQLLEIFGKDIFENEKLLPTMKELINNKEIKPFECVGTKKESKKAFNLSSSKARKKGRELPYLLRK